jgi:ornithine carbamoyltransferase
MYNNSLFIGERRLETMNLVSIRDLSESHIAGIFAWADKLMLHEYPSILKGKTFVLFFPETSIRTRITFEKGIKDLGGECLLFPTETLNKREELRDVISYLGNWADGVIVRHPDFTKLQELAAFSPVPIVNAMTSEEHPCEILSDLYTISKWRSDYRELVYTFVGTACNISRSWMHMAQVVNLAFHQVCVSGHELSEDGPNYKFHSDLDPVLRYSDVVLTDSLPGELRTPEYIRSYQITLERMRQTGSRSLLNPCPPFFRGEEVSEDAVGSEYFAGYGFKRNLIYVQQAILLYCCGLSTLLH